MARKMCLTCGEQPKAAGNAKNCVECWLSAQPMHVQAEHAAKRLATIPAALRLDTVPPEAIPDGRAWCRDCQTFVRTVDYNAGRKRCKADVAAKGRTYRLEAAYSLSPDEYQALYAFQGGRCYLCRRKSERVPLAVDHDHVTGEVRGLLCPDPNWGCNIKVVARFDADPDPVAMALRLVGYLQRPPWRALQEQQGKR